MQDRPQYLYVHAPFCARRCSYCDFAVTVAREPDARAWLDGVSAELSYRMRQSGWDRLELQTIYVGGGTPSLFGTGVMARLAERLGGLASWDAATLEWTCEANPEGFTRELAEDWRAAGVNRVSLGVQTFAPEVLRWMGRLHGPEGAVRAYEAARSAGFASVSLDLIFGLPERLGRDWSRDLDRILELAPDHISLYGLTAEPATPLGRWVREGRETLPGEERYASEYVEAAERLAAAGYNHYEVSNFARPGHESRHNTAYWTHAPYLGLGPGAHSFQPPRRYWNVRDYAAWVARIGADGHAVDGEEIVEGAAARLERSWLGLRTSAGLDLSEGRAYSMARRWQEQGWAVVAGQRVRLTPAGWLLLDRLAVELAG